VNWRSVDERFRSMLVLGVAPGATQAEIKAVYRNLARECHPDRHRSDPLKRRSAEHRLREINQAYGYLSAHPETDKERDIDSNTIHPATPGYDPIGWKESVARQGREGEHEEADEEFYMRALRLYLDGKEHFERARWKEAVSCLLQSVYMVQENSEAYRLLGRAYRRLMLPAKAEAAYKQALRICPDSAETVYELGEIYLMLDDYAAATMIADKLRELDASLSDLLDVSINRVVR